MNAALLKYELTRRNISVKDVCDLLKISKSAFYRKCNGKSEFTRKEIELLIEYLEIKDPTPIFFSQSVS